MPLHSPRFPTIDWTYLDVIKADNTTLRIRLSDLATLQSGAGASFTIEDNGLKQYDTVTLWYMNFAFGYQVADAVECAYAYDALGDGTVDRLTVNGGADATFLRNRLRDHIAALRTHILASHPSAKFELLYPYDVNHPTPAGVHQLGGALNNFINFPVEYELKPGSGLDTLKMEALDFGAWTRSLNLSRTAIEFPLVLGWPKDSVRYLVPVFRGGAAWEKEYLEAKRQGIPVINFWAFDHFNLYNLNCREPRPFASVQSTT